MAASPERAMAAWTQAVTTARPPWAAGMAATLEGGGARRDQGRRAEDHHDRQLLDSLPHRGILLHWLQMLLKYPSAFAVNRLREIGGRRHLQNGPDDLSRV
ncbi:hypothetical protein [Methylobacterium symbioticum]|uniref:hypothetical protein n=2 Tax=Methylobacterium TaxID=407 RepID=UPI00115C249D|nr:hypothetical protein [Methylobacterium symbioticum]